MLIVNYSIFTFFFHLVKYSIVLVIIYFVTNKVNSYVTHNNSLIGGYLVFKYKSVVFK